MSSVISRRMGGPNRRRSSSLLERLDEVLGLVLLDLDVLVAGDAEHVVLEDLHAGEQVAEVVGDEVLERHEAHAGRGRRADVSHEPGQHLRHLQARELLPCRSAGCARAPTRLSESPEM